MCIDLIRFSKQVFFSLDSESGRMPTPESKDKTESFPNFLIFLIFFGSWHIL